jgi:two-component system response regulator YesN
MPWTVLIADDEPKIRRGLRKLLDERPDEFTVVGEAEDGEAALGLASELRPDLLLVDIRMPFVDGLDLVERLTVRQGSDRRVVVISGHDEFEYARKAIGLGVFEFLLKPVEEEVLLSVLRRAVADLSQARSQAGSLALARELAAKNRAVLVEGLFRDGLRGWSSAADWAETAEFLGLRFESPPYLALVAPAEAPGAVPPLGALMALQRLAQEAFAEFSPLLTSWDEGDGLAILAEAGNEGEWEAALGRLETRARDALGFNLSVDRAEVPAFPQGLSRVYDELVASRQERSPHGNLATLALNVLDRRFREPELCLDDVAEELQVSPGHLSRVLKQSTGTAFVDALSKVRVRRAAILLGDPAVKVYEVAERVGYSSQHYFSRAFRRVLGVAPSDYRRGGR